MPHAKRQRDPQRGAPGGEERLADQGERNTANSAPVSNVIPIGLSALGGSAEEGSATSGDVVLQVTERSAKTRLDEGQLGPLVDRARAGDLDAFEEIVRRMQGPVRAFARRMMRDPHLGDDAAQETFLRMWRGLARHESRGKFVAWTFTVARNTCIEFLRREKRTPRPAEEIEVGALDPYEQADLTQMVNDAIAELTEPYRSTILLRETGMQYEEMADALACPIGTVRSRLHEARKQLAERLRPALGGSW